MPSNGQNLKKGLQRLSSAITARVKQVTIERLQEETYYLANDIEKVYEDFFKIVDTQIVGSVTGHFDESPNFISNYMGREGNWKALSGDWIDYKDKAMETASGGMTLEFSKAYVGVTELYKNFSKSRLGRSRAGGVSRVRVKRPLGVSQSFRQYMHQLAGTRTAVEHFFGPIDIEYYFAEKYRTFKVTTIDGAIKDIDALSKKTGKFLMFPREFSVKSSVFAFQSINGVEFSEWYVVDFILKRIDPLHEKQWVKINSRYGHGGKRPIRAIITPLISWYGHVAFKQILENYKRKLKNDL